MNQLGVVISRYYEDLKWVEQLKAPIDVYIYNRFGESPGMGVPSAAWGSAKTDKNKDDIGGINVGVVKNNGVNLQIIEMEDDAGFETSTYSYHFYTRYESLNEITVCLQAHPSIYIKNIVAYLNNPGQLVRTKFSASNPIPQLNPSVVNIGNECIDFSFISDNFAWLDPYRDYGWAPHKDDLTKSPWWFFVKGMPGWAEKKEDLKQLTGWPFGAGNQFMVNKKLVLRHEKEYYKRIQDFTKTYMDPNGDKRPSWQQLNQGPNLLEGSWVWVF